MVSEEVSRDPVPAPRFGVSLRGYDRGQVDSYVADNARWAAQAWGRITDLEVRLSDLESSDAPRRVREGADRTIEEARRTVDQFIEHVDAKVAELEDAVRKGTRPQLDELRDRVTRLDEERRAALDHLLRARASIGDLHGGIRPANGHETSEADGDAAPGHLGWPVEDSGVVHERSDQ